MVGKPTGQVVSTKKVCLNKRDGRAELTIRSNPTSQALVYLPPDLPLDPAPLVPTNPVNFYNDVEAHTNQPAIGDAHVAVVVVLLRYNGNSKTFTAAALHEVFLELQLNIMLPFEYKKPRPEDLCDHILRWWRTSDKRPAPGLAPLW